MLTVNLRKLFSRKLVRKKVPKVESKKKINSGTKVISGKGKIYIFLKWHFCLKN